MRDLHNFLFIAFSNVSPPVCNVFPIIITIIIFDASISTCHSALCIKRTKYKLLLVKFQTNFRPQKKEKRSEMREYNPSYQIAYWIALTFNMLCDYSVGYRCGHRYGTSIEIDVHSRKGFFQCYNRTHIWCALLYILG